MGDDTDKTSDRGLFRQAAAGARRLRQDKVSPHTPRRKPVPEHSRRETLAVLADSLADAYEDSEIDTGEELLYMRPGIQQRVWRKFRRGQYAIEAELDLHGCTSAQARPVVASFVLEAQAARRRCVRIIHGKGLSSEGKLPVLKGKVNAWLRQMDAVLAFCSARRNDGGTGAVYVLLKRP
jgi:DNA-nicking Smr family endonuclease